MSKNNKGLLICITGVDGSGKTTQAKLLLDWLENRNVKCAYLWNRGEAHLRKGLISLGRTVLLKSQYLKPTPNVDVYNVYQSRKSRMFRNRTIRFLWATLVRAEHIFQTRKKTIPLLNSGTVVISDRYIWDSQIDLAVSFCCDNQWLLNKENTFVINCVPRPDINFFIDIPIDVALSRKNDIPSREYIENRIGLYRFLAINRSMSWLNGCKDPEDLSTEVVNIVKPLIEG